MLEKLLKEFVTIHHFGVKTAILLSGANFSLLTILKRSQHSCFCLHTKNMAEIFISKSCKIHCPKAQLFRILMDAKIRKYEKKLRPWPGYKNPGPKTLVFVSTCRLRNNVEVEISNSSLLRYVYVYVFMLTHHFSLS